MKQLLDFILEYKERRTKGFNYTKIEETIKKCKPSFFGNNAWIEVLWTPQIYFNYNKGWSAGKPDEKQGGKKYNGITLGTSARMFINFYAEKKLFKNNIFEGYISWVLPDKLNDDDTNCDELEKYLDKMSNYTAKDEINNIEFKKIKVESYEELKKYLNDIEDIINKHNTKCDKNEPTYLYFDETEASLNSQFKKKQYEILSCEEEIVKLNKELENINKAAAASDVDLTSLIDSCQQKIEYFKSQKKKIEDK